MRLWASDCVTGGKVESKGTVNVRIEELIDEGCEIVE